MHVEFKELYLPDPPNGQIIGRDNFALENLQTLFKVKDFKCSEAVVKRIPNIKKLRISYDEFKVGSHYCLHNLTRLHKLESLGCFFYHERPSRSYVMQNITFPHSLKKLTLYGSELHWEDLSTKIGSLPFLQVLKLKFRSFLGPNWETVEGQFCNLKLLLIENSFDLKYWTAESTHFPRLEYLVLKKLIKLEEIPSGIGETPTLRSIFLEYCSDSAIISAKSILAEQEELGNADLHVRVQLRPTSRLKGLASRNFQVEN